jgi:3-hydroxyacyl-[acyl-carrier-protein] dehydratase
MSEGLVLDIQKIKELIPHRYPMLLVDRIEQIDGIERCVGIKCVTNNEPFFQGHFPDYPIMPGVLIVEAMAQTAGALVCYGLGDEGKNKSVFFMSIDEARFRKPVVPGQVLEMHVERIQNRRTVWKFKGQAKVNGEIHAEATFTAMIADQK